MLNRRSLLTTLSIVTAALIGAACDNTYIPPADQTNLPAVVTQMQAYYCATPGTAQCQVRGDPIPAGTLPPTTESFMVWARTPGSNNTQACVYTSLGNGCSPAQEVQDSTGFF